MRKRICFLFCIFSILMAFSFRATDGSDYSDEYVNILSQIASNSSFDDTDTYGATMADLNNDGIPELIIYVEEAGGIMMRDATVCYWDGDGVQSTDTVPIESSYSVGVYCDSETGEECYLTNVDCLEYTALGNLVDEMVLKTQRLYFDGSNAWIETVADFSQYQGQIYSQELYNEYQKMTGRYRFSTSSRYQTLYNNIQGGYTPSLGDIVSFVYSYRYSGYSKENAVDDPGTAVYAPDEVEELYDVGVISGYESVIISEGIEEAVRIELSSYLGRDYHELLRDMDDLEVLESTPDLIKIGNSSISVTARTDGIVVRIALREDNDTYCVDGTCPGQGEKEIEKTVTNRGYEYTGFKDQESEDTIDTWLIYKNNEKGRYITYRVHYTTVNSVYCGLDGYMPF